MKIGVTQKMLSSSAIGYLCITPTTSSRSFLFYSVPCPAQDFVWCVPSICGVLVHTYVQSSRIHPNPFRFLVLFNLKVPPRSRYTASYTEHCPLQARLCRNCQKMTDPLSVAASIIGLISFGSKLASILHTYIDNVSSARMEIIETTKELEALCLVLRRLEKVYRPAEWDADLRSVLDSCRRIFVELERVTVRAGGGRRGGEFEEAAVGLTGIVGWTRRWKKLWGVLNEAKDIGRLRGYLEAHKATLSITLLVTQWYVAVVFFLEFFTLMLHCIEYSKAWICGTNDYTNSSKTSSISESNERIERAIQEVRDMLQKSDDLSNISGTTYKPSVVLENYLTVGASCTLDYPTDSSPPASINFTSRFSFYDRIIQLPESLPDLLDEPETTEQDPEQELQTSKKRKRISSFLHHTTKIPLLSNPHGKARNIHTFRYPLHVAASNGDEKTVRALTTSKNVNSTELHGLTPLCFAAARGHASIVRFLISAGARVNFGPCELGDAPAPLLEACEYGHLETVRALLTAGANVRAVNPITGARCLHLAARAGSERVVRELLARGADVEELDGDGRTALHAGVQSGRKKVVRALLNAGAEVERNDSRGRTPFEVAWGMNWVAGVDMLVEAGAVVKF